MVTRPAHRFAAVVALLCLLAAAFFGVRHLREFGAWVFDLGNRDLPLALLAIVGFALAASFALLKPGPGNPQGALRVSIVWSAVLLAGLVMTWATIVVSNRYAGSNGTAVTSQAEYERLAEEHPESLDGYNYFIPTGVYLQSFEFLSSSNVEMSGFVWQKYGPEIPESVKRGIVFPEQGENAYEPVEAWNVTEDGVQHIGWYFSGIFRQNFDYRLYPFDTQDIWLRLWHPDPADTALLVPDFAAYRDITPTTLPGLDTKFVYGGWDPLQSYFSYDLIDYNVDFGRGRSFRDAPSPEFYFNLAVARDPLSPMLEHVVLEVAIAILLFLLLVLMSSSRAAEESEGISVFDLIVAAGGLLFAVILDHNSIRTAVQSQVLTYLEWFPIVLDVFLVLVVLSAVLRLKGWRSPLLGYTGDLMPVLAYWPALLGTLFLVTLQVFFFAL